MSSPVSLAPPARRASARPVGAPRLAPVLACLAAATLAACSDRGPTTPRAAVNEARLADSVAALAVQGTGVPAVAIAIVHANGTPVLASSGVRRAGSTERVSANEVWHLGSNTKALTAAVIGALVQDGKLGWSDTPGQRFPERRSRMDPALANATLGQLLSHHAGFPADTSLDWFETRVPAWSGSDADRRQFYADWLLARTPAQPVGTFAYANGDYTVAAQMAERASGKSWETLLRERLAAPLGLRLTIGWPGRDGSAAPWGHLDVGGRLEPLDPRSPLRVPSEVGPAGDVALPLGDYARFVQDQLRGLRGRDGVLKAGTVQALFEDRGDGYGFGWARSTYNGQPVRTHDGSAGTFFMTTSILPTRDLGIVVVTNAATPAAETAVAGATLVVLRALVR